MKRFIAYKYRIHPTTEQKIFFSKHFGARRFIYNHYLDINIKRHELQEKHLTKFDINKDITKLKKEYTWLKEIDDWCLKNASTDLSIAYKNFFDSCKGKRIKTGFPKFKKKTSNQKYRTTKVKISFNNGLINIPKCKNIKTSIHQQFEGKIKSATVELTQSGKYFISILVEEEYTSRENNPRSIGLDLGLEYLLITSDGLKFKNPKHLLEKTNQAINMNQKILARKKKGSINHEKQRIKLAKLYERKTNIRNDYYHNISRFLVNNYSSIYMEDLNINGMLQNKRLSKAIHEVAWDTLHTFINYKAKWDNVEFKTINRFYPSSKTCSSCGHIIDKLPLNIRFWQCPSCFIEHDRDINAAVNILNVGATDSIVSHTTGETGLKIPLALRKQVIKIERSVHKNS